ncbi:unnamed protein product [Eruca vesicaria subsp. sativa]|uniref:Uncharacterized protein n=1 Tax=Eruca vesicaria subsp. sativa TaxID=29727 RepID=A0ABC8J9H8_ERUVS|nr:unnamed protein product [Eruca vesicaria subsp. sativa]
MNLYDDESLKQEVIYLHSLWHQGPPTRNPIPNFNPVHDPVHRSRPNYIPPADFQLLSRYGSNPNHLQPQPHLNNNNKRSRPGSDREWPVNEPPRYPPTTGWPEAKPFKKARPLSDEEKAKLAVSQIQRDVHRACREFFGRRSEEESDTDDGGGEEFQFLSRVFEENVKLKECYEKNSVHGEVWCLVCGGSGEKSVRKFKNCLALVQHSLNIHKTMKNQHRALAQVVCDVLGWDVNNPVISSQKDSQTLGVEAVAEGATELPPDTKKLEEKQHVMSADEQAKAVVLLMQQNASEALKGISVNDTSGSVDETEELGLISRLFSENAELKSYYEKNCDGGHFVCLVCSAATDKKMIKRFKHCHGLVMHSTKTPKIAIRAHKVFARFVCELFGWEFDRLPRKVVKDCVPLVEASANQDNEKPSLMIEEHMNEEKTDSPEESNNPCVGE